MGLSFAALIELGTGRHEIVECDERDFQNCGVSPEYRDEMERLVEWFEAVLFGYGQGTYTTLEVLNAADRVLKASNDPQERSPSEAKPTKA